ncbi:MAG: hypothetical protein GXY36_02960 [Chloroflexi bacterium]|jgi:hypothetical protein|nr:hypothetical protein [Chloroflexota bacterium]
MSGRAQGPDHLSFPQALAATLILMAIVVALLPVALEVAGVPYGYICAKEIAVIVLGALVAGMVVYLKPRHLD